MTYSHKGHAHIISNAQIAKRLGVILILTFSYMCAEIIGGYLTNSLALLADAGHMFSDVVAISLSLFANWLSSKPATSKRTYGFVRAEILAAFINGIMLIGIALIIVHKAYLRILTPPEVLAPAMILVATGGLFVNIIGFCLLSKISAKNINVEGSLLHIFGDLLGSIGAILAGLIIWIWGYNLADPIISVVIAFLILISASSLVVRATNILLEAAPSHIDVDRIRKEIINIKGVKSIHELHVWSISTHQIALSVHIITNGVNRDEKLCEIKDMLKLKFNIFHSTIQMESNGFCNRSCDFMEGD